MSWKHPARNTCPECGEGPLCRYATVYWHAGRGEWTLSESASDYIFCGACAAEFKDGVEMEPKKQLVIFYDPEPPNPRTEHDNLGRMACFHSRYTLGDKDIPFRDEDFCGWSDMKNHIEKKLKAVVCLPVYLYDHSSLTLSTEPFSCPWDSGQIGFIYVTPKQVKQEYGGVVKPSPALIEHLRELLKAEVQAYSSYLEGDCYGFKVMRRVKEDELETIDSCWGFIGSEYAIEGIAEHSGFSVEEVKEAFDQVKTL